MTKPTPKRRPGPGTRVSGAIYDAAGNSVVVDAYLPADAYEQVKRLQEQTGDTQAGAFRSLIFKGAKYLGFCDSVSAIDALAAANAGCCQWRGLRRQGRPPLGPARCRA